MIQAWRIVRKKHSATAFDGVGAQRSGGRWNSAGNRMVYCSSTKSLATLEILAHLNPPMAFLYNGFRVEFLESQVEVFNPKDLPTDWRKTPPAYSTMSIGEKGLEELRSAVLQIPSAIVEEENNYLLNPQHPDFHKIKIHPSKDFWFDDRLIERE